MSKKSYGHQTILFVGISGGTNISTVDHGELNIFLSYPFTTSVARLYRVTTTEHVTDVNNRVRPLETMSYSAIRFKSLFRSFAVDPILISMQIDLHKTRCVGNSPVPGEFPTQRPVTRSFDVWSLIYARIHGSVNKGEAGDLRRHRAHYEVTVMRFCWHLCAKIVSAEWDTSSVWSKTEIALVLIHGSWGESRLRSSILLLCWSHWHSILYCCTWLYTYGTK